MDWGTLATTALGGVLALVGAFGTQWWGSRKALERENRDREHDREVWAPDLRYAAHVDFMREFNERQRVLTTLIDRDETTGDVPEDYLVSREGSNLTSR
jgi:hypothetical protein